MRDYSLTLSSNHGTEKLEFVILPQKIDVSESGNNKSYEISKLGEINVIKNVKLAEISFDGIFPARWFPGANVGKEKEWIAPRTYVDKIQKWRSELRPIHLVLIGSGMDINEHVSIEAFSWSEVAGAPGDIQYQISFKIYRPYSARKVYVVTNTTATSTSASVEKQTSVNARTDTRVHPKTYSLVAGDSLWKVAKKFLGDGAQYKQIQTLNGIKDSELKKLPVGKVIKLPEGRIRK